MRLIGLDATLVSAVNDQLVDLCNRIRAAQKHREAPASPDAEDAKEREDDEDDEDDGVPVLLGGGGRGMKVGSFHLPYLVALQQVTAEATRVVSLGFSLGEQAPADLGADQPTSILA